MGIKLKDFRYNSKASGIISDIVKNKVLLSYEWQNKLVEAFKKIYSSKHCLLFPSDSIALYTILKTITYVNEQEVNFNKINIVLI